MQARRYCYTLNNYTKEEYDELIKLKCDYQIIGKEKGEKGTKHLQGYVEFAGCKRLETLKKINNRIHWEKCLGNQKSNIEYCKKEGNFVTTGAPKIQGKRTDLENAVDLLKEGKDINDIIDEIPSMLRYDKNMERYKMRQNNKPRDFASEVHVLIGEPGSGKTREVHENNKDVWVLPEATSSQWFDGYTGQEVVLIDDFKGNIRYNFLLQLLDRYPMTVNTKGGFTNWRPKKIYITSNYEPEEWYNDIKALRRRFTEVRHKCAGNTMPHTK